MKKFILRSVLFVFSALLIPAVFLTYLYVTKRYESFVNGFEVYNSIKKSKAKNKKRKLLLGDSVAKQLVLYNPVNNSINSLACNQAISIVGQYLLLKNYFSSGNKLDTVILLVNPVSFKNNLDQIYTFQYFLKPFYVKEYVSEFSGNVYNQIKKIPFYNLSQFPLIKASNWSPKFESPDPEVLSFLSPVSREYLLKMKQLADSNNVTFRVYPAPLRSSLKHTTDSIGMSNINTSGLEKEFSLYFKRIKYIDDKYFVDMLHLKKNYLLSHPDFLTEVLN